MDCVKFDADEFILLLTVVKLAATLPSSFSMAVSTVSALVTVPAAETKPGNGDAGAITFISDFV